ncbi:MAG TPA: proton-conducting transporter membrane subunit [Candidatus Baltobacteraceae bacterium]|nr:proton-conducting transporter membrane subunit [Candidatus Baltobacteraceae bacterium]
MIIAICVAAPLAFALGVRLVPQRASRRSARLGLAFVAALLPFAAAGSVDVLSLVFAAIVSSLGFLATLFSAGILADDWTSGYAIWSSKPVYFILLGAFWSAMLLVVLAGNFAGLWLGISLTTLTTAFLVGYSGEPAALEAAWKYLVLCSVGIAIALLGIVVLAHVSIADGLTPTTALSWAAIAELGRASSTVPARLAVALMIVGFATKAGLAPMHAWLPDAHSKAPAPISALLSGVLVSCALYAIMRVLSVAWPLGVGAFASGLLEWFGALSIVIAGVLMLTQTDLKRLLAYSTVEHAGIVAIALGFGGSLGWFAALFHVVVHAFAKSSAFFCAGIVQRERGATEMRRLRGLWNESPSGRILLGSLGALSGMPPFGLFVSELLVVAGGIAAHQWVPLAVGVVGFLLAFSAIARAAIEIEAGAAQSRSATMPTSSARSYAQLPAITATLALTCSLVLAVLPWFPFSAALQGAAARIGGGP